MTRSPSVVTRTAAALTAAMTLSLAACKAKSPPPAAPPAPELPADAACKLVSRATAAALLGKPVEDGKQYASPGLPGCHYPASEGLGAVDVHLYANGQDALADQLKEKAFGAEPVQIANVGTRAYRNADGTVFGVFAKGHLALVKVEGPPPAAAESIAQAVAAAM